MVRSMLAMWAMAMVGAMCMAMAMWAMAMVGEMPMAMDGNGVPSADTKIIQ